MKHDINQKYFFIYSAIFTMILIFFVGLFYYDQATDTKHAHSPREVTYWEDYTYTTTYSRTIVSGRLDALTQDKNLLAFFTVHQNVSVFLGEELIYQYPVSNNNPFSNSPGYCWNFVPLPEDAADIRIELSSPYKSGKDNIPVFYIGNNFSVPAKIVRSSLFPFILCILMFCIGLLMVGYYLGFARRFHTKTRMFYLGTFAIILSIWSINECSMTPFIMRNNIVTSYVSFLSIMLLPLPFGLFIKNFYEDNSKAWEIFFQLNIAQIILCILFQFAGIYDLRETLWSTHVMMGILAGVIIYQSYKQLKAGENRRLVRLHLLCIIICAVTLLMDVVAYYLGSGDGNTFGRLGFLTYIVVLGLSSAEETASLMKKGTQANLYQQLAYTDQMTGLNNRSCFNLDFEQFSQAPKDIAVIDCDLNNLKYTNDTFGHSAGDRYIKNCANIINEIFSGIGKCYRVGGDEFVVLVQNSSKFDLTYYLAMLESSVDACNRENKGLRMQIAYGCAVYSDTEDENLEDTYNRADKIMYEDKKKKKGFRL
ncbi:MAG: GGDEF domain-containing protein [Roseburia sp.]|nr:GGDEF domain-containing protein [Roseburia sp.]